MDRACLGDEVNRIATGATNNRLCRRVRQRDHSLIAARCAQAGILTGGEPEPFCLHSGRQPAPICSPRLARAKVCLSICRGLWERQSCPFADERMFAKLGLCCNCEGDNSDRNRSRCFLCGSFRPSIALSRPSSYPPKHPTRSPPPIRAEGSVARWGEKNGFRNLLD